MTEFRDQAVVLRTRVFAEADRLVSVLTAEHGRIRLLARGVRKTKSRFGARLEPGMHVDLQCYQGRTFAYVTQAVTIAAWGAAFSADFERHVACATLLELSERVTPVEGEPATAHYNLLRGALSALANDRYPTGLVVDAFLLRTVATAGWAPNFTDCAVCGAPGPHAAVSVKQGGSVCLLCRGPGSVAVREETLTHLGALLSGDWPTALATSDMEQAKARGIVAAYSQWHIDAGLRSLHVRG